MPSRTFGDAFVFGLRNVVQEASTHSGIRVVLFSYLPLLCIPLTTINSA